VNHAIGLSSLHHHHHQAGAGKAQTEEEKVENNHGCENHLEKGKNCLIRIEI